jgi:hypothetical protein
MSEADSDGLRALIAAIVRETVADLVAPSVRSALSGLPASASPPRPVATAVPTAATFDSTMAGPARRRSVPSTGRVESIRMDNDGDLDGFARHLLALFENPKNRQDLRAGRYRFTLAPGQAPAAPPAHVRRIERGAVTERCVTAAAEAGEHLLLARGAVLTPLAREKARSLSVHIEKEH